MISAIVSFGMIVLLFLSGRIYESVKRLLMLVINVFLKILNLFGIKINTKEITIKTSRKFKQLFKDIRIVKKSKENIKIKPSINIVALILLILSISIVIINLETVSGNIISCWLIQNNPFPQLIKTQESMDVTLTAILFSIIAFSLSKLVNQWKETAHFRKANKDMKRRDRVICQMSAKELLDAAKQKDLLNYQAHLKIDDEKKSTVKEAKVESNAKNF